MPNTPKVNRDAAYESPAPMKHSGGRPGGPITGVRPIKVTGRDPRTGSPSRTRSPGRAHR